MLEAFDFWMWRRLGKPAFRLQVTHSCSIVARMSACGLYYGLLLFAEHWGEIIHEFGDGWLPNRARLRSERWRRQGVQEALQRQGHQGWMGRTEGGRRGKYGSVHIMYMSFFDCIHVHTYIHVYMSPDSGSLGPPPHGMVPQGPVLRLSTPPWVGSPGSSPNSLLFAGYWQHFWGPASYLLGLCSISDYQPRIY